MKKTKLTKLENSKKSGFELDAFVLPAKKEQPISKKEPEQSSDVDPKIIINRIFSKIKSNDSFLTFTNQISEINKILQMKYASANDIAQVILNDIPLTSKLLKIVNSSYYGHFSQDGIATITEAMIVVGTDQIKFLAASLKLIDLMTNIGDSNLLIEKTLKSIKRSFLSEQIAKESGLVRSEKLKVGSILYDFGEYLVVAFSPESYTRVEVYKDQHQIDLEDAARAVMGISYKDLGLRVANQWNMPKAITNSMKPIASLNVQKKHLAPEDFLPFVCAFANDLCDIKLDEDKTDSQDKLMKVQQMYASLFSIPTDTLVDIIRSSEEKIANHASVLKIAPKVIKAKLSSCVKDRNLINTGIAQIKQKIQTGFTIPEIFESALHCLYDGFRFENVNFCIRNRQTETMSSRYILGDKKEKFLKDFQFKIMKTSDLFNHSLHKEQIMIIDNIEDDQYKTQIPLWFKENRFSDAFAVVPICLDKKIVSMLYLDWKLAQVEICKETRAYLKTFQGLVTQALQKR